LAVRLNDYVDAIKVSWPSIIHYGGGFMFELSQKVTAPIIADFKVADIPDMTRQIVKAAAANGAHGIIIHGFAGPDSVSAGVEEASNYGLLSFVVAGMSHKSSFYTVTQSKAAALAARSASANGIVLPATDLKLIAKGRRWVGPNMNVLAVGVGVQGGSPRIAIATGADYLIIGRSIYEHPDPIKAAKIFAASIVQGRT